MIQPFFKSYVKTQNIRAAPIKNDFVNPFLQYFQNFQRLELLQAANLEVFPRFFSIFYLIRYLIPNFSIVTHKGWQRLLSAYVVLWTESHKIFKVWALMNKVLARYFTSYGKWLTSQIIKSVDSNQSISINQFYPIETSNFIAI